MRRNRGRKNVREIHMGRRKRWREGERKKEGRV